MEVNDIESTAAQMALDAELCERREAVTCCRPVEWQRNRSAYGVDVRFWPRGRREDLRLHAVPREDRSEIRNVSVNAARKRPVVRANERDPHSLSIYRNRAHAAK